MGIASFSKGDRNVFLLLLFDSSFYFSAESVKDETNETSRLHHRRSIFLSLRIIPTASSYEFLMTPISISNRFIRALPKITWTQSV